MLIDNFSSAGRVDRKETLTTVSLSKSIFRKARLFGRQKNSIIAGGLLKIYRWYSFCRINVKEVVKQLLRLQRVW